MAEDGHVSLEKWISWAIDHIATMSGKLSKVQSRFRGGAVWGVSPPSGERTSVLTCSICDHAI